MFYFVLSPWTNPASEAKSVLLFWKLFLVFSIKQKNSLKIFSRSREYIMLECEKTTFQMCSFIIITVRVPREQ